MEIKSSLTAPAAGGFSRTTSPCPPSKRDNYNIDDNINPISIATNTKNPNQTRAQLQQESSHNTNHNNNNYNHDKTITKPNDIDDNDINYNYNDNNKIDSDDSADLDLPKIEFKSGDRIRLPTGRTGFVKYIGNANFSTSDVVGLELDSWNPNASDGIIKGEKIFDSLDGRAWFLRRCSVIDMFVRDLIITEGSYARMKGLKRDARAQLYNGKTVKVVSYVPKKSRWKVKLYRDLNKKKSKYLGVRESNLDPISDWRPKSSIDDDDQDNIDSDNNNHVPYKIDDIKIGDAVKMKNEKWGIVKYIGDPKWPKLYNSDGNNGKIIGLELIKWSPNANNGTVKGENYFKVNDGFGYFTNINKIVDITRNNITWKQERIIWIGFDKNMQNSKCLFGKLPKDIVKCILTLVGHRIK